MLLDVLGRFLFYHLCHTRRCLFWCYVLLFRVDPRSFEVIDLEKFKLAQRSRAAWTSGGQKPGPSPKPRGAELRFEHVELPYRPDATERDRLRLRNNRVTMTHGGKLKRVHIGFASERTDGSHLLMATPWTRDDDM